MNKALVILVFGFTLSAFAGPDLGPKEEHGNPEDEKRCFKEIRNMGCGNPDEHAAFIACVDSKIDELSEDCQVFHMDEKIRMKSHSH